MSDDNKGLIDLRLVVEVLRQHGRFDDEEGEVTNNLQDLIDSLTNKEGAGVPVMILRIKSFPDGTRVMDRVKSEWNHLPDGDHALYATPPAVIPAAPSDAVLDDVIQIVRNVYGGVTDGGSDAEARAHRRAQAHRSLTVALSRPQAGALPDDLKLTLLMAPYHLNLVVGHDRVQLLAFGRDVWAAAKRGDSPTVRTRNIAEVGAAHAAGTEGKEVPHGTATTSAAGTTAAPVNPEGRDSVTNAQAGPAAGEQAGAVASESRCSNCDDTGDVNSITGEWRGVCHCPAGQAINARALAAPGSAIAAREQEGKRTPQDYAIEHAEYMATTAEGLIEAVNDLAKAEQERDDGSANPSDVEAAQETVSEYLGTLRNRIYEFRKRKDRAALTQPTTVQQEPDPLLIDSMCMRWRHDFGLQRDADDQLSSGLTDAERDSLRSSMRQLWEEVVGHGFYRPAALKGMQPGERKEQS